MDKPVLPDTLSWFDYLEEQYECECSAGSLSCGANGVVTCLCSRQHLVDSVVKLEPEDENPSISISSHGMWNLAAAVIMQAMDDAIGSGNKMRAKKHRNADDYNKRWKALQAQFWLSTSSEGRDHWFSVLNIRPPTPFTLIPMLFAWRYAKMSTADCLHHRIQQNEIQQIEEAIDDPVDAPFVRYRTRVPWADLLDSYWAKKTSNGFRLSETEFGSDLTELTEPDNSVEVPAHGIATVKLHGVSATKQSTRSVALGTGEFGKKVTSYKMRTASMGNKTRVKKDKTSG